MIKVEHLVWDNWNKAHIARHDVTPDEVEEVCHSKYVVFDGHKGRFIIVGLTHAGRTVAVILDPEPEEGVYYPVTARSADRKERRLYLAEKGGEIKNDKAA